MSTKTTFKRISLVAVAALGFGMVAAVPSYAAPATTTVVKVGPGAAGDAAPGTAQAIYTSVGTEVTSVIRVLTTTAETAGDLTITPTVACAGTVATTCTGGLAVGAAGLGKVGMTTAGTLGAAVALTATADKWTASVAAGVQALAWSSGTVPASKFAFLRCMAFVGGKL